MLCHQEGDKSADLERELESDLEFERGEFECWRLLGSTRDCENLPSEQDQDIES